jgi:hypothetical protein
MTRPDVAPGFTFLGKLVPLLLGPPFSNYSFLVHHLVNQDDRHLLTHGNGLRLLSRMAVFSKRTIRFFVMDQTPRPTEAHS